MCDIHAEVLLSLSHEVTEVTAAATIREGSGPAKSRERQCECDSGSVTV